MKPKMCTENPQVTATNNNNWNQLSLLSPMSQPFVLWTHMTHMMLFRSPMTWNHFLKHQL